MPKAILFLLIAAAFIFGMGLIMVFNTTSAEVLNKSLNVSTHSALVKQSIYAIIGIILGFFILRLKYSFVIENSYFILAVLVFLLVLVFVPVIGIEINGAKRWVGLVGYTIQPSEAVKIIIPACFIKRIARDANFTLKTFLKTIAVYMVPMGLILIEPDTGTTAIIIGGLIVVFFITKTKWKYWVLPLAVVIVIGSIAAYNMPHVKNRLQVYLHPELDLKGKGHQPYQSKIAAGSGKIWGKGLGESLQKLDYLPEAKNDYIAAIYAEEFGFFGICLLIGAYLTFGYSGFYIAANAIDRSGFYFATIITFLIVFQAFVNLGVISALLPSKGMALPFFSQGGTSLIVNIVCVFLLLSIALQSVKKRKPSNA